MALDYNPDKEGHAKHRWIVMNATKRPMDGVEVGEKKLKFGTEGRLTIGDPGMANEIRQRYGKDVIVTRYRAPSAADRGHTYFFGSMPEMPWKRAKDEQQTAKNTQRETPPVSGNDGGGDRSGSKGGE
jgi:hypothetical protein